MSIEEKLKDLITERYKSIAEFSKVCGIPSSTLFTVFSRGVNNASVNTIIKMCKTLRISADELANGRIVDYYEKKSETTVEILDLIEDVKLRLTHPDNLTLDGKPLDEATVICIEQALNDAVEIVRLKRLKAYYEKINDVKNREK